jgi:hypothetical protein
MRKIGEKIWVFERGFRLLGADKNGKDGLSIISGILPFRTLTIARYK